VRATLGAILVNSVLPEEFRDYNRTWDKKTTSAVMDAVAKKYPNDYRDIVHKLHEIGGLAAYTSGHTVTLNDLASVALPPEKTMEINRAIDKITDSKGSFDEKNKQLLEFLGKIGEDAEVSTLQALTQRNNPLAKEVNAGARGNATQLNSMVGSSSLVLDQDNNPAPVAIMNSLSHGLSPAEYFAQSFGTRRGAISTKMATADSGFLGKQLALAAHRLIATDDEPMPGLGLPVDAFDEDNVGAALAQDVGPYKAGTIITSSMVKSWPKGTKRILVRSPVSDISPDGGVPRLSLGIRENGIPEHGEEVGIPAIQTITNDLSQGALNEKHRGGAGGVRKAGFKVINQLVQVPKVFPSGAAHAALDGNVTAITDAPQGGKYIHIGDTKHYVAPDQSPTVQKGASVEAGDVMSNGLPNPSVIVHHKGIGEGRRYFTDLMRDVLNESKLGANRRNIELMARSVINHVRVKDESDALPGALPGDVVEYDRLAHSYQPREGALEVPATSAKGGYLEKPVLHYSIGTQIKPSVSRTLKEFGVKTVTVHKDPPPFEPYQERVMTSMLQSPDWAERLGGFYTSKGMLDAVHRGGSSDLNSNSYIPKLVFGAPLAGDK
jgi:hypothetical protein